MKDGEGGGGRRREGEGQGRRKGEGGGGAGPLSSRLQGISPLPSPRGSLCFSLLPATLSTPPCTQLESTKCLLRDGNQSGQLAPGRESSPFFNERPGALCTCSF